MDIRALAVLLHVFASNLVECWNVITEHGSSSPDAIANRILQEILQSSETDQTRSNAISYNVSSGTNVLQQIDSGNIEHKIISENDFDTKYAPSTKRFHHDGFSRHGKKRLRHLFKAVSNNRNICDKPFIPPNGALKGHIGHYHVGSKIQYRCDRGYVLHGSFWNKCVFANGSPSWYFQTPSCRRTTCSCLTAPKDGYVKAKCNYSGCIAVYSCKKGYRMSGKQVISCSSNGKWSNSEFRCYV